MLAKENGLLQAKESHFGVEPLLGLVVISGGMIRENVYE